MITNSLLLSVVGAEYCGYCPLQPFPALLLRSHTGLPGNERERERERERDGVRAGRAGTPTPTQGLRHISLYQGHILMHITSVAVRCDGKMFSCW